VLAHAQHVQRILLAQQVQRRYRLANVLLDLLGLMADLAHVRLFTFYFRVKLRCFQRALSTPTNLRREALRVRLVLRTQTVPQEALPLPAVFAHLVYHFPSNFPDRIQPHSFQVTLDLMEALAAVNSILLLAN
jgi:hypothetical protein